MVNGPKVNCCKGCGGAFMGVQRSNADFKLCEECLYTDDLVEQRDEVKVARCEDDTLTPSHLDTLEG